jgi:Ca2+/Na+ antiporter
MPVMTAASGSTIAASCASSPGEFVPISATITSASSGVRSSVMGAPTRLLRLPCVA